MLKLYSVMVQDYPIFGRGKPNEHGPMSESGDQSVSTLMPMLRAGAKKRQGERTDLHSTSWSIDQEVEHGTCREFAPVALQVGEGTVQRAGFRFLLTRC